MKLSHTLFISACCLAAFGCSSTSDSGTDGGGTDGATDTINPPQDTAKDTTTSETPGETGETGASCSDCVAASCASKLTACQADTQCGKDIACVDACNGSAACDNVCVTNECGADGGTTCPPTDTLFGDLITCVQGSCNSACFGKP